VRAQFALFRAPCIVRGNGAADIEMQCPSGSPVRAKLPLGLRSHADRPNSLSDTHAAGSAGVVHLEVPDTDQFRATALLFILLFGSFLRFPAPPGCREFLDTRRIEEGSA
jgi:hypothetical protein